MPKYLTCQQFRDADTGILTPDITDRVLTDKIQDAEATIDAFMGFTLQVGGFEQHRAWTQAGYDELTLRIRVPNFPVPVQTVYGFKIQVSNISSSGAGFFATINPGDCVINVYASYVEIVPLQAVTYALSPVLMQLGLKPPLVQMEYQAGFYFPVVGETLINKGDNLTYYMQRGFLATTYTAALSIQPIIQPPIPAVVYLNGAVQSSGYTLNTTEGSVTFATARAGTDAVSADYTYTIPDAVKQATIARVTWILGQRQLAKLGMVGLDFVWAGEQRAKRIIHPQFNDLIDSATANKLMAYTQIAAG
jgi:hypothetical protein